MHANEESQDGVQAEEPGVTERKSNWRWRRLLTSLRSVICARNRRVLRRCAPLFPVWLVATDIKPVGGVAGKPNLRSRGANGFRSHNPVSPTRNKTRDSLAVLASGSPTLQSLPREPADRLASVFFPRNRNSPRL